jgi:Family of unknown function (DUF5330)
MMFLIRVAFWLSLIILVMPTGSNQVADNGPQLSTTETLSAAGAAWSDLGQFCARQPDACKVGAQAAHAFGLKAQASAKTVYEFLTEKVRKDEAPSAKASGAAAAGNAAASANMPAASSQSSLTAADKVPAWRGPAPRMEQVARATN